MPHESRTSTEALSAALETRAQSVQESLGEIRSLIAHIEGHVGFAGEYLAMERTPSSVARAEQQLSEIRGWGQAIADE